MPLIVEGNRYLYVEPTAIGTSAGRVFLAGIPNYLWSLDAGRNPVPAGSNTLFGAIIEPDGSAHTVASPIEASLIRDIRILEHGDGEWDVIFAEADKAFDPKVPSRVVRLWHGEFEGSHWKRLTPIPLPGIGDLAEINTSSLVRAGDTLAWATIHREGTKTGVVFFSRVGNQWTHALIPARNAAYAQLSHSDSLGFLLAVVQADDGDIGFSGTTGFNNTVILYAQHREWQPVRHILHSEPIEVHHPQFSTLRNEAVLSWWVQVSDSLSSRREAQAILRATSDSPKSIIVIDSAVVQSIPLSISGLPLWVVDHVTPDNTSREIRIIQLYAERSIVIGKGSNPYTGPFTAIPTSPTEMLLSGPLFDPTAQTPPLVSLLLRFAVHCRDVQQH